VFVVGVYRVKTLMPVYSRIWSRDKLYVLPDFRETSDRVFQDMAHEVEQLLEQAWLRFS
jgi:hypothetical protein